MQSYAMACRGISAGALHCTLHAALDAAKRIYVGNCASSKKKNKVIFFFLSKNMGKPAITFRYVFSKKHMTNSKIILPILLMS